MRTTPGYATTRRSPPGGARSLATARRRGIVVARDRSGRRRRPGCAGAEGRRAESRSLEDVVRDTLRPMLKAWLDDNLPQLVERLVREEIERIARWR